MPYDFITDELGKFEKNIIELAENVGFKECKTIEDHRFVLWHI